MAETELTRRMGQRMGKDWGSDLSARQSQLWHAMNTVEPQA